jgi:integrase
MHSDYTFFPRKSNLLGKIYYVRFRDPKTGKRLGPRSSGQTTKKTATNWAINQITLGQISKTTKYNFGVYSENWFIWDSCPYINLMIRKGKRFSRSYADNRRSILKNHILPYFGKKQLTIIDVESIESFIVHLQKKKLSSSSINSIICTFSTIMKEAYRQGHIKNNPMEKVQNVTKKTATKDIIPQKVAEDMFKSKNKEKYWPSDFHYVFNLIAYTTGLRQGEILALKKSSIKDNYIIVSNTWDRKYGLKSPKYESNKIVPLPDITKTSIDNFIKATSINDSNNLLFHRFNVDKAINHKAINKHFRNAVEKSDLDLYNFHISFTAGVIITFHKSKPFEINNYH